jgi:hypothetical protein
MSICEETEIMCEICYQTKCMCNPLYDSILSLQDYGSELSDTVSGLNLTIQTLLFSIGTKHFLNSKGKYENGVLVNLKNVASTFNPEEYSILGKNPPTLPTREKEILDVKDDVKDDKTKKKKVKKTMYNQIEFKAFIVEKDKDGNFRTKMDKIGVNRTQESRLSIMIFTNGSVKVTGIRNPKTILKVSITILDLLKKKGNMSYIDNTIDTTVPDKQVRIWDTRPAMINTVFRAKEAMLSTKKLNIISKKNLQDTLNDFYVGPNKEISMITNRKSQMNIKFKGTDKSDKIAHVTRKGRKKTKNEVTILVFYTGKFSIIGTTDPDNIKKAYRFISDLVKNHPVIFATPKKRQRQIR